MIGNWVIEFGEDEKGSPGFVVRQYNVGYTIKEYHFLGNSTGWITTNDDQHGMRGYSLVTNNITPIPIIILDSNKYKPKAQDTGD